MKDILRSSVVSVPSFLGFPGRSLTPLNFTPKKKRWFKKDGPTVENCGVQEVAISCMKSYLHIALIYPAMALEGSQIHWPCRLHGRVIILDALEMWIWVPQQPVLRWTSFDPPVEWGNKTRMLRLLGCVVPSREKMDGSHGRCWMLMLLILIACFFFTFSERK